MIPEGVDILITHGPPHRILDQVDSRGPNAYEYVGCELLMDKIRKIKPKVHVFGHIHEQSGYDEKDGTLFINASVLNSQYQLVNKPFSIELNDSSYTIELKDKPSFWEKNQWNINAINQNEFYTVESKKHYKFLKSGVDIK